MKIRTFIAIPLDQEIKEKIYQFQEKIKQEITRGIKWVEPQSLHLTLKFLGDVEESEIKVIAKSMKSLFANQRVFSFKIGQLGAFPDIHKPSVIWTGIPTGKDILQTLSSNLEKEMQKLGFPPEEKEFSPHITLGRAKRGAPIEGDYKKALSENENIYFGEQKVEKIILFQSDLQPKGPVYTPLEEVALSF